VAPLARHLGVDRVLSERREFRDGLATGRALPRAETPWSMAELAHRPRGAVLVDDVAIAPLSVRDALEGRHLFIVGGTGFIGKVWLASLLRDVPGLTRITILMRRRGNRDARSRFARILGSSPVFYGLRDEAERRIEVLEGDVTADRLGLSSAELTSLRSSVDLIVNCAGLTDFNPDLRDALAINVDGVLRLVQLQRSCDHAALLHVSTCFVAGRREGRVREEIRPRETPVRSDFDPEEEHVRLRELVDRVVSESDGGPRVIRKRIIEQGLTRARELGWPNIYTFTKGLGEALLEQRGRGLPIAVVRPSIVESALKSPSRGWNEGINTSAPLSHLLGSFFRQLPVNEKKRLDVIPVDLVGRGLTLVSAALVRRRAERVYQLATSVENPLDLRRAVELTALAHRKHYRTTPGWRSRILARLEAVPVSRERYGRFSVPAQLEFVRGVNRAWNAVLRRKSPLARLEQVLARVKELVDLYDPFLLDNEPVFEADHVALLDAALPDHERDAFGYDARSFDWYEYWIHVHIPGLRQWSYPLLEGRTIVQPGQPATDTTAPLARNPVAASPTSTRDG
jgi:long-chain acyl-CoA synthetase